MENNNYQHTIPIAETKSYFITHFSKNSIRFLLLLVLFLIGQTSSRAQVLYGMTSIGGTNGLGNIFKYDVSTATYTNLVNFTGTSGAFIGKKPLTNNLYEANDGNLYGMTDSGGVYGFGNIFKYNTVTNTFTNLVSFTGATGPAIGAYPYGSLVQAYDGNLYGMTEDGGGAGYGNMFKYNPKTNTYTSLLDFSGNHGVCTGWAPNGSFIVGPDSCLYGMTLQGGTTFQPGFGNIFKYSPKTNTMTNLLDFSGTFSGSHNGATPYGDLLLANDGNFYGMTETGGIGTGNVFKFNPTTNTYANLVQFTGTSNIYPGLHPESNVIQATDGNLYGTTEMGGTTGEGVIFRYNIVSSTYTVLVNMTGTSGAYKGWAPWGSLLQASNGKLYGMNFTAAAGNVGNIYEYDINTSTYADIVDFTGTSGAHIGARPKGALIEYHTPVTAISSIDASKTVLLYPNPASDKVNVQINGNTDNVTLTLYDMMGRILFIQTDMNKTTSSFSVADLTSGIYMLKIQAGNDLQITKQLQVAHY